MQAVSIKSSVNAIICLLAVLAIGFTGIYGHDPWTPDEPREAAIALEMAETGDLIIPHLAGVPYIEKPPLYYIATALMLKLIGPLTGPTIAIRLATMLFGLGVLVMTFLITQRLWGSKTGILAVCILVTMAGFVNNFVYIRTDIALSFFVIAAVWCFVEIYLYDRKGLFPLAGLFLAGSFLTKGFIGPALTAAPWAGLAAIRILSDHAQGKRIKRFIISHLGIILTFVLLSGSWMLLLYIKGGASLFDDWFFTNHIGRFTGTTLHKGHLHPGEPLYYLITVMEYGLPWTPLFLYWLIVTTIEGIKKQAPGCEEKNSFLYIWGVGSIVLLTLSVSKRDVYLLPVLSAFAIMSAVGLKRLTSKWFTWYAGFCTAICVGLMTIIIILPLASMPLPERIPAHIQAALVDFNYYHVVAGVWLMFILLVMVRFRKAVSAEYIMILATVGLIVSLRVVTTPAINQEESMAADIRSFVSQVPESQRARIAGYGFDEIMRGSFYYYTGWRVPLISDENRVKDILREKDGAYDSLIVNYCHHHGIDTLNPALDLAPMPYRILAKQATGENHDRKIFWIKGEGLQ